MNNLRVNAARPVADVVKMRMGSTQNLDLSEGVEILELN